MRDSSYLLSRLRNRSEILRNLEIQMALKHLKEYPGSLTMREIQFLIHRTHSADDVTFWQGCGKHAVIRWWESNCKSHLQDNLAFVSKLQMPTPFGPTISPWEFTTEIYHSQGKCCTYRIVTATLLLVVKDWKQHKLSTNRKLV